MPPQQPQRLLDLFQQSLGFRAHDFPFGDGPSNLSGDLTSAAAARNRG
jgi:hypothetical protein